MSIFSYAKKHSLIITVIVVFLVFMAVLIGRNAGKNDTVTNNSTKKVTIVHATDFKQGGDLVGTNGIVESKGQADLRSQISAPVSVVHGSIGDSVYEGQVILELQNSDILAQLNQAKASLKLAESQYSSGGLSLDSAKNSAIDKIRDAYLKAYEAVKTDVDPLLGNDNVQGGRLSNYTADSRLINEIINLRVDIEGSLRDWDKKINLLSVNSNSTELVSIIDLSEKNLNTIDQLLLKISQALNDSAMYSMPDYMTIINNWKIVVSGARTSISGATQALTAVEASLTNADTNYGSTAPAQVSAAKAGVDNLEAQLAKTIIKSPINGKIAELPLGVGELASAGQLLATVVGEEGLEVKAYVSGEDLNKIKVGAPATIKGKVKGTVESVAPSVSSTNRKVEVIISIDEPNSSGLIIGQNVQISIKLDKAYQSQSSEDKTVYILPIQNVKIIPGDAYVFTVDENSKIKRNPVVLGEVKGDFIEVIQGISDDMNIVSPVYELDEGQLVTAEF